MDREFWSSPTGGEWLGSPPARVGAGNASTLVVFGDERVALGDGLSDQEPVERVGVRVWKRLQPTYGSR